MKQIHHRFFFVKLGHEILFWKQTQGGIQKLRGQNFAIFSNDLSFRVPSFFQGCSVGEWAYERWECKACDPLEITSDNKCKFCPYGEVPDSTRTKCKKCRLFNQYADAKTGKCVRCNSISSQETPKGKIQVRLFK